MTTSPTDTATQPLSEADLRIGGMTCASCSSRVQRHLNKVEGVEATVNLATELAHVRFNPDLVQEAAIVAAVERAGYAASVVESGEPAHEEETASTGGLRLAIAAALSVPVVAMSMVPAFQFGYWQWLALILATPVVLWAGSGFHVVAFKSMLMAEAGMDTLISIGSLAAWGYSLVALFFLGAGASGEHMRMSLTGSSGDHPIYLEVAAGVVTLILLGRYLESRARRRAGDAVRALLTLQTREARILIDGNEQMIDIRDLKVGDRFVVRPGEKIPTDGQVDHGTSTVDTSLVTGEAVPREVAPGDEVTGATINLSGRLIAVATRVGASTTLAQIAAKVSQAQEGKAKIQRIADRVSAVFVPIVLVVAVATLGYWYGQGVGFGAAFSIAVAVLIVACPCAMGLATPVALMAGTGRGAQLGILIGGAEVLESTQSIDTVVFDKTGTLTVGEMSVVDVIVDENSSHGIERVLGIAGSLEGSSNHPIAKAITAAAIERFPDAAFGHPKNFTEHAGSGVTGIVDGSACFVGSVTYAIKHGFTPSPKLLDEVAAAEDKGHSIVAVGWGETLGGLLILADSPRPQSAQVVQELRTLGLRVVMLTGDRRRTALAIAAELDIPEDDVIADVMPTGKSQVIENLQQAGATVAMIGDGINDAPALAQANLGISMGGGSDVAIQASDITLVGSEIRKVADAIRLSRRTLRTIQGNLFWAFAYNVLAIPLAATGNLNPLIAAAAMAFSSLFVVLNSLRLRAFKLTGEPT